MLAILHAKEVPSDKGGTMFADMRAAYDTLPEARKQQLEGLTALHGRSIGPAGEKLYGDDRGVTDKEYREVRWPAVTRHPVTDRPILFVNPMHTYGFVLQRRVVHRPPLAVQLLARRPRYERDGHRRAHGPANRHPPRAVRPPLDEALRRPPGRPGHDDCGAHDPGEDEPRHLGPEIAQVLHRERDDAAHAPAAVVDRASTAVGRSAYATAASPARPTGSPHSRIHCATTFSGCVYVK